MLLTVSSRMTLVYSVLGLPKLPIKIGTQALVVIANYVMTRILVFPEKKEKDGSRGETGMSTEFTNDPAAQGQANTEQNPANRWRGSWYEDVSAGDNHKAPAMQEETVKKIQKRLLEIAVITRDILERHGVRYIVTDGTYLGMVRHEGHYIPWDDDFDMSIIEEDYDLALRVLEEELPEDLMVEYDKTEPRFVHGWARVRDLTTRVTYHHDAPEDVYVHHGLALDLLHLRRMRRNEIEVYTYRENIKYYKRLVKAGVMTEEAFAGKEKEILAKLADAEVRMRENPDDTPVYATIFYTDGMTYEEMFPAKREVFEGEAFNFPATDRALVDMYGPDYMTPPPPEKRLSHYKDIVFLPEPEKKS